MNAMYGLGWFGRRNFAPRRAPGSRIALPTAAATDGLCFTEWLVVGALGLAFFLSISQPLFGIQLNLSILKHFPLMLLGPALALHFLGVLANRKSLALADVLAVCWPLMLLALYALAGSAAAKWLLDIEETYLAFGAYLLLVPFFASLAFAGERARSWGKAMVIIWVVTSLAALVGEAFRFTQSGNLHEIEYLVASGFFVLFYVSRTTAMKLLAIVLLIASAAINHKITGYIITAMAVIHFAVAAGWSALPRSWRGAYGVSAAVLTMTLVAVLVLLYFEYRVHLPSGNPEVRLAQYEVAWRDFLDSPVWGAAYLDGSGEGFRQGLRLLNIPTHSDVLDILKHGGLIGFVLFFWGYWKIFAVINRAVPLVRADRLMHGFLVGARFFQVTALVTFAINPLLLKGPFLIVIFGSLGVAFGVALACVRSSRAAAGA